MRLKCGGYYPVYYFHLTLNGKLNIFTGIVSNFGLEDEKIEEIEKEKTIKLSVKQFDEVKTLLENLGEFQGEKYQILDDWECLILYQGNQYEFTYGVSKNENYDALVSKFVEFSPMIIECDGYEVKPFTP